jgi:hypothetical protein
MIEYKFNLTDEQSKKLKPLDWFNILQFDKNSRTFHLKDINKIYCILYREDEKTSDKSITLFYYDKNYEKDIYTLNNNNISFNSLLISIKPFVRELKINNLLNERICF